MWRLQRPDTWRRPSASVKAAVLGPQLFRQPGFSFSYHHLCFNMLHFALRSLHKFALQNLQQPQDSQLRSLAEVNVYLSAGGYLGDKFQDKYFFVWLEAQRCCRRNDWELEVSWKSMLCEFFRMCAAVYITPLLIFALARRCVGPCWPYVFFLWGWKICDCLISYCMPPRFPETHGSYQDEQVGDSR